MSRDTNPDDEMFNLGKFVDNLFEREEYSGWVRGSIPFDLLPDDEKNKRMNLAAMKAKQAKWKKEGHKQMQHAVEKKANDAEQRNANKPAKVTPPSVGFFKVF